MVQMSQTSISPSLAKKLDIYSAKNDVSISKDSIAEALDFLTNHTDLSPGQKEDVIEKAVTSVFLRRKTHRNYEGDEQLDPKSFGKEVVLICTEKGIKIKRAPKGVRKEVKDKYENFSDVALDNAYVILDMQPDLDREDSRYVVIESVLDTLNNHDSFEGGEFNYELFGQNMRENLVALREAKKADAAADHLMDLLTDENDKYEGSIADAYAYYDDLYNLEDDDFEDYFEDLFMDESQDDSYDGDDDSYEYLFKKKKRKAVVTAPRIRSTSGQPVTTPPPPPKPIIMPTKKQARKARREKQGSRIGNLLTGGVSGALKRAKNKIKAKREAKKSRKATALEMAKAKTEALKNQQGVPPVPAEVTQTAVAVQNQVPQGQEWTGDAIAAAMPEPMTGMPSGGGGGGGGGEMPQDWGGQEEEPYDEEIDEEGVEEEELPEDNEDGYPIYPDDFQQYPEGVYSEEEYAEDEWYPEDEDDSEIANFFGFRKKAKSPEPPDRENMYFENFTGQEEGYGTKVLIALVAIGLIWLVYKNGK